MANIRLKHSETFLLGDVHGQFGCIKYHIRKFGGNCNIIQVGDFGAGMPTAKEFLHRIEQLNRFLVTHDVMLYVLRGNHDCPYFFYKEDNKLKEWLATYKTKINVENYINRLNKLNNIYFIQDYSVLQTSQAETILCIGGGISIDRKERKIGVKFFKEEPLEEKELQCSPDIMIMHVAPINFPPMGANAPIVNHFCKKDTTLKSELIAERELAKKIFLKYMPKKFFYGHFHKSYISSYDDTNIRCLGIDEFYHLR